MPSLPTPPPSSPSSARPTNAKAFSVSSPGTKTRAGTVIVPSTPPNTSTESSPFVVVSSPGTVPATPPSTPPKIKLKLIVKDRKRLRTMDEPAVTTPSPPSKKRKVAAAKKKRVPVPAPPPPGNSQIRLSISAIGAVPFVRESRARRLGIENQVILGWDGDFEDRGDVGGEVGDLLELEEFPLHDEELAMEMIRAMEKREIEVV